jgi:hypothetical protein
MENARVRLAVTHPATAATFELGDGLPPKSQWVN